MNNYCGAQYHFIESALTRGKTAQAELVAAYFQEDNLRHRPAASFLNEAVVQKEMFCWEWSTFP
jgi:hypothetical protein